MSHRRVGGTIQLVTKQSGEVPRRTGKLDASCMTRPGHAYARGNAPHDGDDAVEEVKEIGMRIVGQGTQKAVGKIAAARIDRMALR